MRLDVRDPLPKGMEEYLSYYGWHFSKALCNFAVSRMYKDNKPITPYTKETVESLLNKYGISLKKASGYDCVYVANMCMADYLGSSIIDEAHLVRFIKDYIDDEDGYKGLPMTRFYADIIGKGVAIPWEDML